MPAATPVVLQTHLKRSFIFVRCLRVASFGIRIDITLLHMLQVGIMAIPYINEVSMGVLPLMRASTEIAIGSNQRVQGVQRQPMSNALLGR